MLNAPEVSKYVTLNSPSCSLPFLAQRPEDDRYLRPCPKARAHPVVVAVRH